jgi:hypothetical protein
MEIVSFEGWQRCAKLESGNTEMIVTLDVGPRIISYGLKGGLNEFYVDAGTAGKTGGKEYIGYGGHRLWIAPENWKRTYQPENEPIETFVEDGWNVFQCKTDCYGMKKQIRVKAIPEKSSFLLEHRIYNEGAYEVQFAMWCLSQVAAGGTGIFPQAPFVPHTESFLPVRPLVLWGYTKMTDSRWTWGDRVIRLQQDPNKGPQKCGMLVKQGYAAYANHGNLFLKRFPFEEGAIYEDYGCNFETFTNESMLEIESLGPIVKVAPGDFANYRETWYLIPNVTVPEPDGDCADWLDQLAIERPL